MLHVLTHVCALDNPSMTTLRMEIEKDEDADLIFFTELLDPVNGLPPPQAKQGYCEWMGEERQCFIKEYVLYGCHTTFQAVLTRGLHNAVHAVISKDSAMKVATALHSNGYKLRYLPARESFLVTEDHVIINGGQGTLALGISPDFFHHAQSFVGTPKPGLRGNTEVGYSSASQDFKGVQSKGDIINRSHPKDLIEKNNATSLFIEMSEVLEKMDPDNKFHCGRQDGEVCRKKFALPLLQSNVTLTEYERSRNVLEYVGALSNTYKQHLSTGVIEGVGPLPDVGTDYETSCSRGLALKWYDDIGVPRNHIMVLNHVDYFNGHLPGRDFFGTVSSTFTVDTMSSTARKRNNKNKVVTDPFPGYQPGKAVLKQRFTYAMAQRKQHEDESCREDRTVFCARFFERFLSDTLGDCRPEDKNDASCYLADVQAIQQMAENTSLTNGLFTLPCHWNKSAAYGVVINSLYQTQDRLGFGKYRLLEQIACTKGSTGSDKIHRYFAQLVHSGDVPQESISIDFNHWCLNFTEGNSINSHAPFI